MNRFGAKTKEETKEEKEKAIMETLLNEISKEKSSGKNFDVMLGNVSTAIKQLESLSGPLTHIKR